MRIQDIIEGVNDDFLYHATEIETAVKILDQNKIEARTSHTENLRLRFDKIGVRPSEIQSGETSRWVNGVSLTRSLLFAKSWKPWGVVFAFDIRALRARHRITPVTFYARHQENTSNIPEAEEFLIGPINNMARYLTAVHISRATIDAITNKTVPFDDIEPEDYEDLLNHPKLVVDGRKWKFMVRESSSLPSLSAIRKMARSENVDLEIELLDQHTMKLVWIDRYMSGGIAGSGALVLGELCGMADERGMKIILTVKEGDPKLVSFYERFGFNLTGTFEGGDPVMMRHPA
jgi:hypothetical protein